ncbi:MAG: T9SS type A sorting domain-containing protein [Flavobacterium sp.]
MKNLYPIIRHSSFLILFMLFPLKLFSQVDVIWTATPTGGSSTGLTGTYSGAPGNVTAVPIGPGFGLTFRSFNPLMFQTTGPWPWPGTTSPIPVRSVQVRFPENVIITSLLVTNIDASWSTGTRTSHNDSFTFSDVNFNSFTAPCCVTTSGVTISFPTSIEATWRCSDPTALFTINYVDPVSPTAILNYYLKIVRIPQIGPICINTTAPDLPETLDGITGSWSPSSIDTSAAGTFSYVFAPTSGQTLECPVTVDVTISPVNLILASPANDVNNLSVPIIGVRHREASNTITATNKIGFGNNAFQNGVVYHAGSFVDLRPGFDAINGSQFSAYIEECSGDYLYKDANPQNSIPLRKDFSISPNPSNDKIQISSSGIEFVKVSIVSIDGKTIFESTLDKTTSTEINVNNYANGVYIVSIVSAQGQLFTKKLLKN